MKKFINLNIQRFGSTNKTTHYELSQYVGTDKPTYLGDYNGDMLKIDTAIYNVSEAVSGVSGSITVINGNIGTLASLTTTDKTDLVSAINEVDTNSKNNATNIGTLANLETENKTNIVNAINEIQEYFNINSFESINSNDISISGGSLTNQNLSTALNQDGTLGKFYGRLNVNKTSDTLTITINTDIRPSENLTLTGSVLFNRQTVSSNAVALGSMTISTSGVVTIELIDASRNGIGVYLLPCLYFFKNFGDTPIQQ